MAPTPSPTPYVVLKDYPHHQTKNEGKEAAKIPIFKLFSELGKIWKAVWAFQKSQFSFHLFYEFEKLESIHIPRPTFQNPNFESMVELGKVIS